MTDRVVAHSSRQRHCVLRSHTTRERFRGVRITRKSASPHPPQPAAMLGRFQHSLLERFLSDRIRACDHFCLWCCSSAGRARDTRPTKQYGGRYSALAGGGACAGRTRNGRKNTLTLHQPRSYLHTTQHTNITERCCPRQLTPTVSSNSPPSLPERACGQPSTRNEASLPHFNLPWTILVLFGTMTIFLSCSSQHNPLWTA